MIPIITVVTSDHGAAVVWFVASGTDPDLVSPLVSDLREMMETEQEAVRDTRLGPGTC